MTPRDLVYWLNGFFELSGATALSAQQVEVIKQHLALVKFTEEAAPVFDWSKYTSPYRPDTLPSTGTPPMPGWAPEITCSDSSKVAFC